jgi:hypothetical protein
MKQVHNLCTKKITEFTTEDTIYIRDNIDNMKPLHLCKFLSYDSKKGTVTGEITSVEDKWRERIIGNTIT